MQIWIDGDACPRPVKAQVFKTAQRLKVAAVLVANSGMAMPRSPLLRQVVVGGGIDEADRYITQHSAAGDLVVSADIPLAAKLVDRGASVIDPRGKVYNAANVKEALATRNLMQDLRESGLDAGGPAAFSEKDRERFANALDRELTRLLRMSQ